MSELKTARKAKAHKLLKNHDPVINPLVYDHDMLLALQYFNVTYDNKEKRKWVIAHYPKVKFNSDLSDYYYRTLGTLCRILDNGNTLSDEHLAIMAKEVEFLSKPSTKVVSTDVVKPVASVQEKMDAKVSEFLADFAGVLDDYTLERKMSDVPKLVNQFGIRGPMIKKVLDSIARSKSEIEGAIAGKDAYLVEGYSNFKKLELKKLLSLYESLTTCLSQAKVMTVRKTRVVKAKPPAVIAKRVKFCAENKDLGLKSLNPAAVVGMSEVWIFNGKYRKLTCYKAIEGMTLTYKGTTLQNWDTEKAICKTVRKPEPIKGLISMGTRAWQKFMKELTSKPGVCNGRINDETLILATFR